MTIYVHFVDSNKPVVRLFNVDAVVGRGAGNIEARMTFSDTLHNFTGVKRVVVEPETNSVR